MLPKIQIQTPEGVKEYLCAPNSIEFEKARDSGEIMQGMEIVYRRFIVYLLADCQMLVLSQLAPMMPHGSVTFTMGGPPV